MARTALASAAISAVLGLIAGAVAAPHAVANIIG